MKSAVRLSFIAATFSLGIWLRAAAADWPDGYVVHDGAQSPHKRYGILVPTYEEAETNEASAEVNYLADLKNHRLLGKIKDGDYFEHQNHAELKAVWADNSTWCVVEYDGRFGFASIAVLEPTGSSFVQTDIGKKIDNALAEAIRRNSRDPEAGGGDATTYFRLSADRKLRVRAISTTDPKQMSEKGGDYALFQGTFDVASKKWLATDARPLSSQEYNDADTALDELDTQLEHTEFDTPERKAEWLDDCLNEVYRFARAILPTGRFAKVKQEQVAWLKARDSAKSAEEKSKLTEDRIKALQDLLW